MPISQISNPFAVNAPQGNVAYSDKMLIEVAGDPYGNVQAIASVTAANPGVWTTSAAHGFVSGQQIVLGYVAGYTPSGYLNTMTGAANNSLVNGIYTVTVLSSTTFSVPVNTTGGTLTVAGSAAQGFQTGQLVTWQSWNGSASGNTAASTFPTVTLSPITTADFTTLGPIQSANVAPGNIALLPTTGTYGPLLQVCVLGLSSALFDATTTANSTSNLAVPSVARPGCAKPASATSGKNIGGILQSTTVSSAYLMKSAIIYVRPS